MGGGVAARVEGMAAAKKLENGGGRLQHLGREKREDGGGVAAKGEGGGGGGLPTRGFKRGGG
jgi:hypothetical protein